MLNVKLDLETEAYLIEMASREKTTPEALIKSLILQRWGSLQTPKTIVERLGGHPEPFLQDAPPNLSERKQRKRAIADHLMKRYPQQFSQ
ncbi:MAG: hypothetical protein LH647_23085 [Leptolyngbyaceae cyanobacterium CAN_BIN12]|nr:hypothetical protein [Leptolyngbyaceae cyanobacterium CAN_BIN12]